VQAVVPPSLPSWEAPMVGTHMSACVVRPAGRRAPGAGPTCTAAVFAQRTRRFTADFPHESLASLQEYDGRNVAARL